MLKFARYMPPHITLTELDAKVVRITDIYKAIEIFLKNSSQPNADNVSSYGNPSMTSTEESVIGLRTNTNR